MIDVAIIPARGGSKRLPNKNLRIIGGKPMIAWTIEAALSSKCFERVIVTTDNDLIAETAMIFGADVPFMRPKEFATDTATSIDVILHAIEYLERPSTFALLQPTSPLRTSVHIKEAVFKFFSYTADALISVSQGNPASWLYEINSNHELSKLLRGNIETHSQKAKKVYAPNGAIYLCTTETFLTSRTFIPPKSIAYEMSHIDSIDIDDIDDFRLVECILDQGLRVL